MQSILTQVGESLLSLISKRFKLFRTARLQHEAYIINHGIQFESITPEQRRQAVASPELSKVENLYREALEITESAHSTKNVAIVHNQLGLLHFMRGDLDSSLASFTESLSLIENQPQLDTADLDIVSTCQTFLALIALENGDRSKARQHILKAKEIDETLNNPVSLQIDQRVLARCE